MRILFMGSGEFAVPSLLSIFDSGHHVVAVVTQPDRVRGRGQRVLPTPVKAAATEAGVPVLAVANVNAPEVVERIRPFEADLCLVVAFGQKIGRELLGAFPVGIVNVHGSLLPALRGAGPIQWAIINGLRETGVTVFRLVEEMDAGPVLLQRRTEIGEDETADELHDRLARIGCDAVSATLRLLEEDPAAPGTAQDLSRVTYAPKLKKEDARITFQTPVAELARRICGLWSWPGAKCRYCSADASRSEAVTLARAAPYEGKAVPALSPDQLGRLTEMLAIQGVDRELSILEIKPAGGRLMDWRSFVNGRHVQPGDRFIPIETE